MTNIVPLEIVPDVRQRKTSASSFAADRECLGRRNLINALPPELLEAGDEFTEYGNAVHKALETANPIDLNEEQFETYGKILTNEEQLLSEWTLNNQLEVITKWGREERMWITDEAGNQITSAQLDRYWLAPPFALVIDVKSLFAPHLPRAVDSWQLRVQAVCLWLATGCDKIRVAYNAPNRFGRKTDTADFTIAELQRDMTEIRQVCWRMSQPDAPRTPGTACRYCAARGVCPEAAAYSMLPSIVANTAVSDTKADVQARVALLQPADWAFIQRRASIVKNILDAAAGNLRALGEDALAPLGFKLGKGRTTTEIPNQHTKQACEILSGLGLPDDDLWQCLSVNKAQVVEAIIKQHGFSKAKATELYDQQLGSLIAEKTGEPILREI